MTPRLHVSCALGALALGLLALSADGSTPPLPRPEPSCSADQLAKIPKLSCPRGTRVITTCPGNVNLEVGVIKNAVRRWCVPKKRMSGSRLAVGVAPLEGGLVSGPYRLFYASGKLAHKGQFPTGHLSGKWTKYYDSGVLASVKYFSRSSLTPRRTIKWYRNGTKAADTSYPNGRHTAWHNNGTKWVQGRYRNGRQVGTWIEWSASGVKKSERRHK